jgi:glycerol 2-dehydrogenase (NADP+)
MAVLHAIRAGYRHIDCAWCYQNQDEVGEGIQEAISSGIVTRSDLWVTSKLWNTFHEQVCTVCYGVLYAMVYCVLV